MTQYFQPNVSRLLRESLLRLCSENVPYAGRLEIDGIVCITSDDESRPLVVKVHEILQENQDFIHISPPDLQDTTESRSVSPNSDSGDELSNAFRAHKRTLDGFKNKEKTISNWGRKRRRKSPSVNKLVINEENSTPAIPVPNNTTGSETISIFGSERNHSKYLSPPSKCEKRYPSSGSPLVCSICYDKFESGDDLCTHNTEVHRRYTCTQCFSTFTMSCNLRRHQKLHLGVKPFACNLCESTFSRNDDLKLHLMKHTRESSSPIPPKMSNYKSSGLYCNDCCVLFTSDELFKTHSCVSNRFDETNDADGSSNSADESIGLSNGCFKSSASPPTLQREIKEEPMDLTMFASQKSNESSPLARELSSQNSNTVKSLLKDVLTSNANNASLLKNQTFGGKLKLNNSSSSSRSFPFGADSPGSPNSTKDSPTNDINDTNNNSNQNWSVSSSRSSPVRSEGSRNSSPSSRRQSPRPFGGDVELRPGMVKVEQADLVIYEQQMYTCTQCDEKCDGFALFDEHCEHNHYIFPCRVCRQTFTNRNNRQRHERSHLGSKCYSCPDCGKGFTRSDILREHRITHTQAYADNKCAHCGVGIGKKAELLNHIKKCARQAGVKLETIVNNAD